MYVIYSGRLAHQVDYLGDSVLIEFADGARLEVPFGSEGLVIDPTDAQVEAARAGRAIPPDPEFEAEVRAETIAWLTRSANDPKLAPEIRAHAQKLLAEAQAKK